MVAEMPKERTPPAGERLGPELVEVDGGGPIPDEATTGGQAV